MKEQEKQLLLQDICARLPYGVKVYNTTFKESTIQTLYGKISGDEFLMEETYTCVGIDGDDFDSFNKRHYTGYIDFIKPYLRPMSSMTEEELHEYNMRFLGITTGIDVMNFMIWIYQHHLDIFHFIEKGLALEAPEGMYNIKEK